MVEEKMEMEERWEEDGERGEMSEEDRTEIEDG
jgi:hypothetical protein